MLEPVETTIDDVQYRFNPLMADPARKMLDLLLKRFGPTLASFIEGLQSMEAVKDFNIDKTEDVELLKSFAGSVGSGIREFTQVLEPGFHKQLVDTFLKEVDFINEKEEWQKLTSAYRQTLFGTKLMTETKLLKFCMVSQYSDFFEPLRRGIASATLALARTQSISNSQKDLTGQPGGSSAPSATVSH